MSHWVLLVSGFLMMTGLIARLVRRRRLQVQFAFLWVSIAVLVLIGSIVVPRSPFLNDGLGISPTGALLGLFAIVAIALFLSLGVAQARTRELLRVVISELAIQSRREPGDSADTASEKRSPNA